MRRLRLGRRGRRDRHAPALLRERRGTERRDRPPPARGRRGRDRRARQGRGGVRVPRVERRRAAAPIREREPAQRREVAGREARGARAGGEGRHRSHIPPAGRQRVRRVRCRRDVGGRGRRVEQQRRRSDEDVLP